MIPVRCGRNLKSVILKLISTRDTLSIACEIVLGWMLQDLTENWSNNGSASVQCNLSKQTTSHNGLQWEVVSHGG